MRDVCVFVRRLIPAIVLLIGLLPRLAWAQVTPGSRVLVMPGVAHVPMIERPEASAKAYLDFRASLAVAR